MRLFVSLLLAVAVSARGLKKSSKSKGSDAIEEARARAAKATACEDYSGAYLVFAEQNLIGDTGVIGGSPNTGMGKVSYGPGDNTWFVTTRLMCVEQEECLARGNLQTVFELDAGDGLGSLLPGRFVLNDAFAGSVYKGELTYVDTFVVLGSVGHDLGIMNFHEGSLRGTNIDTNQEAGASTVGGFDGFFVDAAKLDSGVLESYGLDPNFCTDNKGQVAGNAWAGPPS